MNKINYSELVDEVKLEIKQILDEKGDNKDAKVPKNKILCPTQNKDILKNSTENLEIKSHNNNTLDDVISNKITNLKSKLQDNLNLFNQVKIDFENISFTNMKPNVDNLFIDNSIVEGIVEKRSIASCLEDLSNLMKVKENKCEYENKGISQLKQFSNAFSKFNAGLENIEKMQKEIEGIRVNIEEKINFNKVLDKK